VESFAPRGAGMTPEEREFLHEWRWWSVAELEATADDLVPRDLAARVAALLADGLADAALGGG
jgi:hypothetical protein